MALKEVIMNSCILFYIIFEVVVIIVWIENKYIKDAKEKILWMIYSFGWHKDLPLFYFN